MKRLLTIIRGSLHTIAYALVLMAAALYFIVKLNVAGLLVEHSISDQLAEQLGTRVTVEGDVEVDWLNQVVLNQLTIYDQQDDTLLYARRVLIAYDVLPLLSHHLVLNTCQLIDFDIRAYRPSADSVANYQFLIEALRDKNDPDSKPFVQRLDLNAILLRQGNLSYQVLGQPHLHGSPIDPNHIAISKLSANVHVHDNQIQIKKFHCMEHQSSLVADRCDVYFNYLSKSDNHNITDDFKIDLVGFELTNDQMVCKADVNGSRDEMAMHLSELSLPNGHHRLPGIKSLQVSADLQASQLSSPIDSISLEADIHEFKLRIDTVGLLQATGNIEGSLQQASLSLQCNTDFGDADISAILKSFANEDDSHSLSKRTFVIDGHILSDALALGKVLPKQTQLGHAAIDLDFGLEQRFQRPLSLSLSGKINQLEWRDHTYSNILADLSAKGHSLAGNLVLNDTLGNIAADFEFDRIHRQHRYKVNATVERLAPNALHLTSLQLTDSIAFDSKIHADILASSWQDMEGVLQLSDLRLTRGDQHLDLEPIVFEGTSDCGNLSSPIMHLQYQRDRHNREYQLKGRVPTANDLFDILRIPVSMSSIGRFDAHIDSLRQIRQAHIELPAVDLRQGRSVAATLDMKSDETGALLPLLYIKAETPDHKLSGQLNGRVNIKPLEVEFEPAIFQLDDEEVKLTGAHLRRTSEGGFRLDSLLLAGGTQWLAASGSLGRNGEKDLAVQLNNFDLSQLFGSLESGYLHFGGRATGNVKLGGNDALHLTSDDLEIRYFSYIDTLLGNANISLDYDIDKKHIDITCDIATDSIHDTHIDGLIQMGDNDLLDLQVYPDHLPIGFINYWTGGILQDLSGHVTDPVRLIGPFSQLQLYGDPTVDCRFTHQMLGAHFHLNDVLHLERNLMQFDNAWVDDCHGHPLTLNARIPHHGLHNFEYDITVDMPESNQGFLALDRQRMPGRIYWGQLYAKGHAHLKGGDGKHRFTINVGTADRSWFYLSPREKDLNPDQAAYTFLTFRDKEQLEQQQLLNALSQEIQEEFSNGSDTNDKTDLQVDLQVNVSDNCLVTVQMDPLSDDLLTGRGQGNLSIRYDPARDITLAGTYRINQGTYTMNVKGDLMSKVFQLQNTSNVRFNGNPSEAELQLDCRYNIPSVNLTDLDESITTLSSLSRSSVPVDCNLNISGPLSAPVIRFDLEVKNVSDEIQAYVHNVIGTQEMLNQEVLYLLLFSKFYTPQYAQSTQSRTGSELTSFASASITSQLNQLLGHLSNNFTMGTNIHTDKGDFSDMEMDLSLSTRLLGDRLLLNGNVGYRDPASRIGMANNNASFIGDFDLEFLINNSGTMRAKAYSHYNERDYSINNALTTQGIGFILRKDFKEWSDLLPWWKRRVKATPKAEEKSSVEASK